MIKISEELFHQPSAEFSKHLNIENNERIIFSGKFGMGKSTFLEWYFSKQEVCKRYNVIHLFPVNYSVATNEDIFRYIKYDIITELLNKNYQVEEADVKLDDILKTFFRKNSDKVAASIIYMIPLLGKQVVNAYDKIKPLIDIFDQVVEEAKNEASEGDKLVAYIEQIEKSEGNIFEADIITKVIESILERAKEGDGKSEDVKENVLIIDDLDRIDPEHIFRLLNVFAAHFDQRNSSYSKNKFGFDKIIFVCDIENIRNIFKSKFGLKVDFNGYIDKFYSNTIHNFNSEHYFEFVYNSLTAANVKTHKREYTLGLTMDLYIKTFLEICIKYKMFDLRNVVKWTTLNLDYEEYHRVDDIRVNFSNYSTPLILKFLHDIKGDISSLYESINSLKDKELFKSDEVRNRMMADTMLFINPLSNGNNDNITIVYPVNGQKLIFRYEGRRDNYKFGGITVSDLLSSHGSQYTSSDRDFIFLVEKAIEFMDMHHML